MNDAIRSQFPILENKVYLNSCSKGALSLDVKQAYADYLHDWDVIGSPWEYWMERAEAARSSFAELVNASPQEIALTTSASAAVSALATAFNFDGERNKIVVSDFDFPTMGQIWLAQEPRGAEVVHVPAEGNMIPIENFEAAIDERTKIVAISHVCYRNGSRVDVPAIIDLAHRHGALVVLDSYQALGTFPIDVKALNVDFLVGGVLKYLLGSAGLAYLYVRQDLIQDLVPTVSGWFAQANIFAMDLHHNDLSPNANRFEFGTPPNPNIYAALAGMNIVKSVGLNSIEEQLIEVTSAIIEGATEQGFDVVTPPDPKQHGALVAIRSNDVTQLVTNLAEKDIITSSRDGNLRVSPHFYNTLDDVNSLLGGLVENRALLTDS